MSAAPLNAALYIIVIAISAVPAYFASQFQSIERGHCSCQAIEFRLRPRILVPFLHTIPATWTRKRLQPASLPFQTPERSCAAQFFLYSLWLGYTDSTRHIR